MTIVVPGDTLAPSTVIAGDITGTLGASRLTIATNARELNGSPVTPWSTVPIPWLNNLGGVSGVMTSGLGYFNVLAINDQVAAPAANFIAGLYVAENVFAPSTGIRFGIYGHTTINSTGVNTPANALYSGVQGRIDINGSMGGVSGTTVGSGWGANFIGAINAGTFLAQIYGAELDVFVAAGASVDAKIGCLITKEGADAVQGTITDSGLMIADTITHLVPWKQGITFGRIAAAQWPFDNTSTMIGVSTPGAVNKGIDFTGVAFTGPAITVPGIIQTTGNGGKDTSQSVAISTVNPVTATAFTPSATRDCILYWKTTGTVTLGTTYGPTTGAENVMFPSGSVSSAALQTSPPIPAGWKVIMTGTVPASVTVQTI